MVAIPTSGDGPALSYAVPTPREGGIWAPGGGIVHNGRLMYPVGNGEDENDPTIPAGQGSQTRTSKDILRLLREVVDGLEQMVVMVTHDPIAASYADTVVFLADGAVVDTMASPSPERVAERMTHLED